MASTRNSDAHVPVDVTGDLAAALLEPSDREAATTSTLSPTVAPMRNKLVVFVALSGLVLSGVFQSEASQALQEQQHFNKPFFIVCFNHSMTGLLLPGVILYYKLFGSTRDRLETSWCEPSKILHRHSVLPVGDLFRVACFFSIFYLAADYFWYAALTGVSVTAASAIANCSPLFVYCFSICFLNDRLLAGKVLGVFIAFAGVTLILLYQDTGSKVSVPLFLDGSFIAGILVVISAALTAGYGVAFKVTIGAELTDSATVLILSGFIGMLTIPLWIVGTIVLDYCPFPSIHEPAGWPSTHQGMELMFLSGLLAVMYNACMPLLLCWTSPLETSVGGMLTIPLCGIFDTIFHHTHFSVECILGTLLVMSGFGVLEYASRAHKIQVGDWNDEPEEEETAVLLLHTPISEGFKPHHATKEGIEPSYST